MAIFVPLGLTFKNTLKQEEIDFFLFSILQAINDVMMIINFVFFE